MPCMYWFTLSSFLQILDQQERPISNATYFLGRYSIDSKGFEQRYKTVPPDPGKTLCFVTVEDRLSVKT